MKTKVINVKPYNLKVKIEDNKFVFIFDGITPGNNRSEKQIKIHLDNWWIPVIAQELWDVIKMKQKEIDSYKANMLG